MHERASDSGHDSLVAACPVPACLFAANLRSVQPHRDNVAPIQNDTNLAGRVQHEALAIADSVEGSLTVKNELGWSMLPGARGRPHAHSDDSHQKAFLKEK